MPPQNYNRRWRVLNYSNAVGRAHNLGGDRLFATDDPALTWLPAYSDADGSLPQDLVTDVKLWSGMERRVVQCELEMTTPGTVSFAISGPAGLKLVTGEQIVDVQPVTKVTLPAGIQKIALFSDTKSPNAPLKLELTDAPANTGRGRWVNGR